jgi:DNA-binding GntR family transcriptional regulator
MPKPNNAMPSTRAAAVSNELRRLILSGELPWGTKLRQVEISDRFGVSTTPVREAFTTLAREGLVQQDAHRGVQVILPSQDDLSENYEMRILLEPLATEHAAARISDGQLAELKQQQQLMNEAVGDDDTLAGELARSEAHREFHRIIYDAAGRPRLAELIEQLRNSAEVFVRIADTHPPASYQKRAGREHAAIMKALANGDGERAAAEMRDHLQRSFDYISKSLAKLAARRAASDGSSS